MMDDGEYSQAVTPDEEKYDYDDGTARNKSYNYEDALKLRFPEHRKYVDSHNYVPSKAAPIYERPLPTNRPLTNRFRRFEDSAYQASKPNAHRFHRTPFRNGYQEFSDDDERFNPHNRSRGQSFNNQNDFDPKESTITKIKAPYRVERERRNRHNRYGFHGREPESRLITSKRDIDKIMEAVNSKFYSDDPLECRNRVVLIWLKLLSKH
ncbi:hypothetical protein ACOME3_008385 [Neoechinorhynchus agilis]